VGLVGGVDDEVNRVTPQVHQLAQVENDVQVPLGVDEIPKEGIDAAPVVEADIAMNGDDHRPARPADAEQLGSFAVSYFDLKKAD